MIYPDFNAIADRFDTLFVDAYGVFWGGTGPIPNSLETMAAQVQQGKRVCILSNTTMIEPESINNYTRKGLVQGVHYTDVITSGGALRHALMTDNIPFPGHRLYPLGHIRFKFDKNMPFRMVDTPEQADIVFFETPQLSSEEYSQHPEWQSICIPTSPEKKHYDILNISPFLPALKQLQAMGLPAISTNPDLIAREGEHWIVRQGTCAEIYRSLGGQVVEYGKPYKNIYDYAFQKLGIKPSPRIAMIGDTFRTDIRGALDNGITPVWCIDNGVAKYEEDHGRSLEEQAGGSLDGIVLIHHL